MFEKIYNEIAFVGAVYAPSMTMLKKLFVLASQVEVATLEEVERAVLIGRLDALMGECFP